MSDELRETVTGAQNGDAPAIEALFVRFLPMLERHLARHAGALVKQKESISDLTQSVCREVLEQLRDERFDYRGEAQFVVWLQQAAVHKLQNRRRFYTADKRDLRREVEPPGTASGVGPGDPPATDTTPSHAAARSELAAEAMRALAQLPERDRRVIERCHIEQRSHGEVAELLGVTESHSRVLLARALARLAQLARKP